MPQGRGRECQLPRRLNFLSLSLLGSAGCVKPPLSKPSNLVPSDRCPPVEPVWLCQGRALSEPGTTLAQP